MPVDSEGEDVEDNDVCIVNDVELVTQHILHDDMSDRKKNKNDVCKYWKTGKCYKGEKCNYLHTS